MLEHPVCGRLGSSPHTRGAPCVRWRRSGRRRIIPAYPGSISSLERNPFVMLDHPRIRGEHPGSLRKGNRAMGSSPHTRGALDLDGFSPCGGGIIPAYAGSTGVISGQMDPARDHPRIRGEHSPSFMEPGVSQGSSPHTRGARSGPPRKAALDRIIPAYAGSTVTNAARAG